MDFRFTRTAEKDLRKLDKKEAVKILRKIKQYSIDPFSNAKKLKNFEINTYRFRVGDYRVIFRIDGEGKVVVLVVLRIAHRKDVYRKTAD